MTKYDLDGTPSPDTNVQTILAAGTALAVPFVTNDEFPGAQVRVVPDGYRVDVTDLEKYWDTPARTRRTVSAHTLEAFVAYMQRWHTSETTVWVDALPERTARVTGIVDDHAPGDPKWADHRMTLNLAPTPEWTAWQSNDCRSFDQEGFAEFIEDNAADLVTPSGADLLELVSSFHASSKGTMRSAVRLDNGTVQMQYDEEVTASAGKSGVLQVPTEFSLALSPFLGSPKYAMTARFRYRLREGKVSMSFKLDRPERVYDHAVDGVVDRLSAEFDRVYRGVV